MTTRYRAPTATNAWALASGPAAGRRASCAEDARAAGRAFDRWIMTPPTTQAHTRLSSRWLTAGQRRAGGRARMSRMGSPRAGQPAAREDLIDVPKLVTAYYAAHPDPGERAQRVSFG